MNKMRLIALLVIFLLSGSFARSQEVIYSAYERFDTRSGDFSVVGKVGGKLYTYRGSNDGFFLDAYNDSMERLATVMLDFFPQKIYETRFIAYPDQIIVLYQSIDGNKVIQHAAQLDNAGRLLRGPITLTSAKTGLFGPNRDYFSSAVSDDKKYIMVYGVEDQGSELEFTGILLDDQLTIKSRSHASFRADNSLSHGEGIMSNNGVFYLPAYTTVGSRDFADQVWLLTLQGSGTKFDRIELPLNNLYAASTYMKLDNTGNRIYIGGFYSDKRNGNYEGVIYTYYDIADKSFHNRKTLPFDERLRNATGERNKKRAFNDYQVREMIIKKDGGFVLISEDYFVTSRNNTPGWGGYYSFYNGPYMSQSVREYHYDDILGLSYSNEGTMEWHSFIRKSQYSQEDGGMFSSYALLNTGGVLGFLFNDFNTNRSRIQLAAIDGSGKVSMRSLAAGGANDPDWLPRSGKQVSAREIVVPCLRKRQICFAKIVF